MSRVVIYHANCYDGMAAAWAAQRALGLDIDRIPANYGDSNLEKELTEELSPEDEVYILDFSFKREFMKSLYENVGSLVVLDHHKTAQKELDGCSFAHFDMNKSGARLTWEYFFPNQEPPRLVTYIEDRDIWRNSLPHTNEVNAYIQSFPIDIRTYQVLHETLEDNELFKSAMLQGQAILRYKDTLVDIFAKKVRMGNLAGYIIPVVNAPILMSEVGHKLCQDFSACKFSASYFFREDGKIQWSLRSIGDFDVSAIAKSFGGGGHKNAAGFEVDPTEPRGSVPIYPYYSI